MSPVVPGRTVKDQGHTTLAVIEDHSLVRELLVRMLSDIEGLAVSGSAGTIAQAQTILESEHPDIILLDVVLPDGSGIDWARSIKKVHPDIKILFLTAFHEEDTLLEAINTGAEGYMVKTSSCERLIDAVRAVAAGEHVFDPSITATIIERIARIHDSFKPSGSDTQVRGLSAREMEIATLASNGLTNKEIANAVAVSVNTVKTHLRHIYQHLNVGSRRDLIMKLSERTK
jgi:two-component system, NarL family, response regulator DevR